VKDEWRVTMLDVGQGLAMVIEREGAALLYDTGLAWPRRQRSADYYSLATLASPALRALFSAMSILITAAVSIRC
jgi:beta-lactamase superfamily II metal-dependent hydrolase